MRFKKGDNMTPVSCSPSNHHHLLGSSSKEQELSQEAALTTVLLPVLKLGSTLSAFKPIVPPKGEPAPVEGVFESKFFIHELEAEKPLKHVVSLMSVKADLLANFQLLRQCYMDSSIELKAVDELFHQSPTHKNLHKYHVCTQAHTELYERLYECFSRAYDHGCFPEFYDPENEEELALAMPAAASKSYNLDDVD